MTQVHPWIKSYPEGVRWDIEIEPGPVQKILDDTAAKWPERPALDFMGKRISYRELHDHVGRAAKGLQALGVGPGVHVGLYLPNTPHYVIAFFGVLKAGGTVVNYSPLDAAQVLEHKIEDSRTDILVTLDLAALYPQMGAMLGKTRLKKLVVGNMAEMSAQPDAVAAQMKAGKLTVETGSDTQHVRFAALLDNDGRYQEHPIADPREQIAVLQYTGGTTGLPKGAMLTHGNLSAACQQYWATVNGIPPVLVEGQERVLAVLPPFHIYALSVNMLLGIRAAAELILHTALRRRGSAEGDLDQEGDQLSRRADDVHGAAQPSRRRQVRPALAQVLRLGRRAAAARGRAARSSGDRLPPERRLGHDRDVADRHLHAGARQAQGELVRHSAAADRDPHARHRRPEPIRGARRTRRDLHPRPERDEGLLEQARSDRRGDDLRRHAAHRRRRHHGRGRLRLHRRPHQGHDPVQRLQRLPAQPRGRDLPAPGGRRGHA